MDEISIFFMYSPDRRPQFLQQWELMQDMELFDRAQKIVLVDGEPNVDEPGMEVHRVPRSDGDFCWANMWDSGVNLSRNEAILYLDSDRILPKTYLPLLLSRMEDNKFLFCEWLFSCRRPMETGYLREVRDYVDSSRKMCEEYDHYVEAFDMEPRFAMPLHGPGKGPMSGNTAFTKSTYLASGGVDPGFLGHGAFADTDFHHQCVGMGMAMEDTGALELHLFHEKLHEGGGTLTRKDVEVLSLNNFIIHCRKWGLGYRYPKAIAGWLGLGDDFVGRVVARVEEGGRFVPLMS